MTTQNSMPISKIGLDQSRALATSELIDRLAAEMRAKGDRELPHSFYVEQVKRTLANAAAANDDTAASSRVPAAATSSVFHCWAHPE